LGDSSFLQLDSSLTYKAKHREINKRFFFQKKTLVKDSNIDAW